MKRAAFFGWLLAASAGNASTCVPALNPDLNNDGQVNLFDTLIIARSLGLTPEDPRYRAQADTDCNGLIDRNDLNFVAVNRQKSYPIKPQIEGALHLPFVERLTTGEKKPLFFHVDFKSLNRIPFSVVLTHALEPTQGLDLNPLRYETIKVDPALNRSFKTQISALKPGTYQLVTTAAIPESGQRYSKTTQIEVTEPKKHDLNLSLNVAQLSDSKPPDIGAVASVAIQGKGLSDIERVLIQDEQNKQSWQLTKLNPNQYDGRLIFRNSPYGTCVTLMAAAIVGDQTFTSASRRLCLIDKRPPETRTHLSLYMHPNTLTDLPNAGVMAEATVIGPRRNAITRVEIYSKDLKYRWQLPKKGPGQYRGRLDLSAADYGQCFEFIAKAFGGGETLDSFFMQPLCLRDQYGRPVIPWLQEITHPVE